MIMLAVGVPGIRMTIKGFYGGLLVIKSTNRCSCHVFNLVGAVSLGSGSYTLHVP